MQLFFPLNNILIKKGYPVGSLSTQNNFNQYLSLFVLLTSAFQSFRLMASTIALKTADVTRTFSEMEQQILSQVLFVVTCMFRQYQIPPE